MSYAESRTLYGGMKTVALWFCAAFYIAVGGNHFTDPDLFVLIVPAYLPEPLLLVHISGVAEILGGVGLLWRKTRPAAAWGILALLVAVYPANINMLVNDIYLPDMPQERWMLWARMPMQFILAGWVIWVGGLWSRRNALRG
jgi:uncharacterized membrane protein